MMLFVSILLSFQIAKAQNAEEIFEDIKNNKIKVIFHGMGTEPFWDVFIIENGVVYGNESTEEYEYFKYEGMFDKNKYSQVFKLKRNDGELINLQIIKKTSSDGMSEIKYPYTVTINDLMGCGELGDK